MACCSQSACARRSTLPATAFHRPLCSLSRSARHSCADRAVRRIGNVHQRNKCRSFCHLSWQAAVRTLAYGHARLHVARWTHSVMAYIAAARSVRRSSLLTQPLFRAGWQAAAQHGCGSRCRYFGTRWQGVRSLRRELPAILLPTQGAAAGRPLGALLWLPLRAQAHRQAVPPVRLSQTVLS